MNEAVNLLPEGVGATVLKPLELNAYRFRGRHTPLTPDSLKDTKASPSSKASESSDSSNPSDNSASSDTPIG